jgi:heme O synthase-like polyprenyltransferase
VVVSLTPPAAGLAGSLYLVGALVLGIGFAAVAVASAVHRDLVWARRLFLASLAYLVLLCAIFFVDRLHG